MSTPNDGGPAFPGPYDYRMDGSPIWGGDRGMTLRDWFAGKALEGWLASYAGCSSPHPAGSEHEATIAQNSYSIADAMLAARSKKQEGDK